MRRSFTSLLAAAAGTLLMPSAALAGGDDPAGGAALGEIVLATAGAVLLTGMLLGIAHAHRTGRTQVLERLASRSEEGWGIPGWAALPGIISGASLFVALVGMYWDISLHIADGRDPGPLANPAHYLILAGLFGTFAAGLIGVVLPRGEVGRSAVRITRTWHAPLGAVLLLASSAFALSGFPLDDLWHRLFGQDVTLWGPTHLMLIGGAAMTLIGRSVLLVEGARAGARTADGRLAPPSRFIRFQQAALVGGWLVGLSTFQAEFDFGVPQFQFVFQPILVMLAAAAGLVVARIWAGPGGAVIAAITFVLIRGFVAVLVGPVLGEPTPHLPLYLAEAALVELVALRMSTRRPLVFGAWAGALIGTVGLAAEWGWSHVWMPLPWPASLVPEALLTAPLAALCGGLIGGLVGASLSSDTLARPRGTRPVALAASAGVAALLGFGLLTSPGPGVSARVTLEETGGPGGRTVGATVALEPRSAAEGAEWLTMTAWQGQGFALDRLERVAPGVYRTTEPVPVHGDWKALIRLHRTRSLLALPLYLPEDPAIPAAGVPAESSTRRFVTDKQVLQREARDASPWLSAIGYGIVLILALLLLGVLAWGLRRLARYGDPSWSSSPTAPPPPAESGRARPPVPVAG